MHLKNAARLVHPTGCLIHLLNAISAKFEESIMSHFFKANDYRVRSIRRRSRLVAAPPPRKLNEINVAL